MQFKENYFKIERENSKVKTQILKSQIKGQFG
jgi:hypothetical protein